MGINLGSGAISKLYLGATEIQKAYLGGTLVYDAAPAGGLLLDNYPNAAAAYSLRQLRTGVTNVVRVRESGGNTEADFTATQITDGTLAAFCGANDGFVTIWYDQSMNGRNVTQATTSSQPQIVSSGVLIAVSGKPAINFDNQVLQESTLHLTLDYLTMTVVVVSKNNVTTRSSVLGFTNGLGDRFGYGIDLDLNLIVRNQLAGNFGNTTVADDAYILMYAQGGTGLINNLTPNITTGGDTWSSPTPLSIGKYAVTLFSNVKVQEVIIWPDDQDVNQLEINSHYGIY